MKFLYKFKHNPSSNIIYNVLKQIRGKHDKSTNCESSSSSQEITLSNGMNIPILGLGTWGSLELDAKAAVKEAVKAGYRLIDCAHFYQNERYIGLGLKDIFKAGKVKREELFIVSKLWNTFHRPDLVEPAICMSLQNLNLEYLDLYLMHWPMAFQEDGPLMPFNACGRLNFSKVNYLDTWNEMSLLVEKGYTKAIGLCNFNTDQIQCILENSEEHPVVNQIECHPFLTQCEMMEFCAEHDIAIMAYSPLGSPQRHGAPKDEEKVLENKTLEELSNKYKKTPAQILIRYQIQRGNIVIPKSVTKERIISNSEVFDWSLEDDDMAKLDGLNRNHRYIGFFKLAGEHPDFPFSKEC